MFPIGASPWGPDGEDLEENAKKTSEYLRYTFRNEMKIADPMERGERSLLKDGNAFWKEWWKREERNVRIVERFPSTEMVPVDEEAPDGPAEEKQIPISRTVQEYFEGRDVTTFDEISDSHWKVKVFEKEEKRTITYDVHGWFDEDDSQDNMLLVKFRRLVEDRPAFDFIPMDDIYFSQDAMVIDDVRRVHVRHFFEFSDVVQGRRRGHWIHIDKDDELDIENGLEIDKNTEQKRIVDAGQTQIPQTVERRQDEIEGASTRYKKPIEVWESFYKYDIDGDGELEEITIWSDQENKKIYRVAYTSEEYHTDKRPILHAGLIPQENRLLHIGLAEALMPIVVMMNKSVNQRYDHADLQIQPPTYYRPGSGHFPTTLRTRPGAAFPLENPQTDIHQPTHTGNPLGHIQVEQFLMAFVEDLSMSSESFGRSQRSETARGTLAHLQQDQIKLDYILGKLFPMIDELCHRTLDLIRLNGSKAKRFKVVGGKDFIPMTKDDLLERIDFHFDLDSISGNREVKRIYSAQALEGALEAAMLPPEQLPPGARKLLRNFLASQEVPNPEDIFPDPPGFEREPGDQMEENRVMARGVPVDPVMADDHETHLREMEMAEQFSDWFDTMTPEWSKAVWRPHKLAHLQMKKALDAQRAELGLDNGTAAGGETVPGMGPGGQNGGGGVPGGLGGQGVEQGPASPGSTLNGGVNTQF